MRESVSAILICDDELFIIQRQNFLKAFPGYFSFPGGKVDDEDHDLSPIITIPNTSAYLTNALVREVQEELGLDLEAEYQSGNLIRIVNKAVAITPDFNPHRFKNYYFKIYLKTKPNLKVDTGEAQFHGWMQTKEAFKMYQESKMLVVPPMISILSDLSDDIASDLEIDPNLKYDGKTEVPLIFPVSDIAQFLPLSHTFPPANRTNCFYFGDEFKVLVDPSPKDDSEYKKLVNTLAERKIDLIFITHNHPDHHERATKLSRDLNVPIGIGEYTRDLILKRYGRDYFDNCTLKLYSDGDTLTQCHGKDVLLLHTPGHDEGQLSIYRKDMAWMIVTDLIQTVGTVVVGGEEGDMNKYFRSLEKVIAMKPLVIFPSHGIGIGGTYKLAETLKHRKLREAQVKEALDEGLNKEETLDRVYPDLDDRLKPYALLTIEAHINKIHTVGIG